MKRRDVKYFCLPLGLVGCLAVAGMLTISRSGSASPVRAYDLRDLVLRSELVVVGRVIDSRPRLSHDGHRISTVHELDVAEVLSDRGKRLNLPGVAVLISWSLSGRPKGCRKKLLWEGSKYG